MGQWNGIPEKDIDRIFDRGFTGENGRKTTKSTGMGLYICKKVADQLNFNIEVSSEVSKYTEFKIIFYKLSDYLKVTKCNIKNSIVTISDGMKLLQQLEYK